MQLLQASTTVLAPIYLERAERAAELSRHIDALASSTRASLDRIGNLSPSSSSHGPHPWVTSSWLAQAYDAGALMRGLNENLHAETEVNGSVSARLHLSVGSAHWTQIVLASPRMSGSYTMLHSLRVARERGILPLTLDLQPPGASAHERDPCLALIGGEAEMPRPPLPEHSTAVPSAGAGRGGEGDCGMWGGGGATGKAPGAAELEAAPEAAAGYSSTAAHTRASCVSIQVGDLSADRVWDSFAWEPRPRKEAAIAR